VGGVLYRDFVLDIDESKNDDRFLSLDKFKVYLSSVGNLDNYTESPPEGAGSDSLKSQDGTIVATKIFDIDTANSGAGDASIALNYALNHGSGNGIDLVARVPDSLFQNSPYGSNPFVYLYSSFGATGDLKSTNANALGP
jgi:hypothetical protein